MSVIEERPVVALPAPPRYCLLCSAAAGRGERKVIGIIKALAPGRWLFGCRACGGTWIWPE